jgi:hypothetical protein
MDTTRFRSRFDTAQPAAAGATMIIRDRSMIEMLVAAEPSLVSPKITERAVVGYPTIAQHHSPVNEVAEWPYIMQDH